MTNRIREIALPVSQRGMAKDELFRQAQAVADFNFGEKVASVFDDMVDRSVPFYQEVQRMKREMTRLSFGRHHPDRFSM